MTHLPPIAAPPEQIAAFRAWTVSPVVTHAALPSVAPGELPAAWLVGRDRSQVRHARHQAREALAGWGLAEHASLVELVVSELVTNALQHGAGPIGVRLTRAASELRVDVHDDGGGRPISQQPRADDESGRGLALVEAMTEPHGGTLTVSGDNDGPGKTVRVTITVAASPAVREPAPLSRGRHRSRRSPEARPIP
jgi:signal transduction histidine kinase